MKNDTGNRTKFMIKNHPRKPDLNCNYHYRSLIFVGKSGETTKGPLVSSSEKEIVSSMLFAFYNTVPGYCVPHQT